MILTPDHDAPVGSPHQREQTGEPAVPPLRVTGEAGARAEQPLPAGSGAEGLVGRTIAPGEVLRWFVHPALDEAQTWGATHVALDLVLEDGARLSELAPTDQHGSPATARGLGEARILVADQWNDVQVSLEGLVGRTVAEALVVLDAPGDPEAHLLEDLDAEIDDAAPSAPLTAWIDGASLAVPPEDPDPEDPVAWVDTRRGTHSVHEFSRGNTLPITALPNAFAKFTPATDARTRRWIYQYHRTHLQGLSLTRQPSPWMGDRHQLVMMPLLGEAPGTSPAERERAFRHADETARPDLYAVDLEGGIGMRLAPTDHGAVCEISLPAEGGPGHLLLEGVDAHCRLDAAGAVFDGRVEGWIDASPESGNDRADGATRMFVLAEVDPAPVGVGRAGGDSTGSVLSFAPGTRTVTVRLVTSLLGLDQARRTFALELAGRSLEEVREEAHALWTRRLQVIEATGASPAQRRTLAGNLYRLNLYPSSHWENRGSAEVVQPVHASPVLPTRGAATDSRTNAEVRSGRMYVDHGFWDTYRTAWPAYALLYPELAAELADGFVQQHREGGWIARWSSPGYADCMTGTSSDIAFADLQVKGVPLPDPEATYEAALRNATVAPHFGEVGRKGGARAVFRGYVASDDEVGESVSWSLEAHINDAGIAAQAALLAERAEEAGDVVRAERLRGESAYLASRSANYALLFDPETEFFRGRRADGSFSVPAAEFDPLEWGGDFTEADGWTFAFHAPHDPEGLAALQGGRDMLRGRLEQYFDTPERADRRGTYGSTIHEMVEARAVRMGQFGFSNQPCHHIPFLFHHVGAPEEASRIVREVQRRLFVGEQIGQGYPGDEDNGEMSAWWLLTALGLYPLQLATGRYHLVAPLFDTVQVRPLGAPGFTITARAEDGAPAGAEDVCITGMRVNGEAHEDSWIDHSQLSGEIEVALSASPRDWGTVPPSPTAPGERPQVLRDLFAAEPGNPLLDDDACTELALETESAVIDLPELGEPMQARFLTLTSAEAAGGDPIAWRLEGSADGERWEVLDARSAERFPHRRQTRPFQLSSPRPCTRHRLVVTTSEGPLRLAELELLA